MTDIKSTDVSVVEHRGCRSSDVAPVLPTVMQAPSDAPMRLHDWVFLNAGDRVVVQLPDGQIFAGLIDAVANDASVFWLWKDGGGGRTAVYEEEGCKVWKTSNWIGITACDFTK
ncbi:hypothetical protein [Arthrobacter sp. 18067]|uniref:hypothetical protein n=1 Tax=Arthrobacter sp. 18067 TaxID=2681413 RepID=UPI00135BF044|nr:hypothetical protein [Arthrobacter sp. 18067]